MKGFTKKHLKISLAVLMAAVLVVLLGSSLKGSVLNAKADETTYTLTSEDDDLNLIALDAPSKEVIPAGNYGTNGYFTFSEGNFRANSDHLIIETVKRRGSNISFTVTEGTTATVEVTVSSNGSSNKSYYQLTNPEGLAAVPVGESEGLLIIEGSKTTFKYNNLSAGTYTLESVDGGNSSVSGRGFRLYSISVTETPADEIKERADWSTVATPVVTELKQLESSGKLRVITSANLGYNGGDKVTINVYSEDGKLVATDSSVSESTETIKDFVLTASGNYYAIAVLEREGAEVKNSEKSASFAFVLPLSTPVIGSVTNNGSGSAIVAWDAVPEATTYEVLYKLVTATEYKSAGTTSATEFNVTGLVCDSEYDFVVKAKRGDDVTTSSKLTKIVRDRVDRKWTFSYFGQSVNVNRNVIKDLNEDAFTFKLLSCTFNEDGTIKDKGGKFTTYYDGISYYFTEINAATENFVLTATFKVDYINPTPDGQEGFGLIIRDSIGENGVSNNNFETNSASLIATKFEMTVDGTKYSMKDGLGVRFSYGMNSKIIADGTINENATSKTYPMQFENGNLINAGDTYTLTIKKTNTGYHCIYDGQEYILYGVDKLLQIDPEHVYVGFAVARGCNVSVSDVTFTVTDAATDAPAEPEPAPSFPVGITIVSPETSGTTDYIMRFRPNCDGTAYISNVFGQALTEVISCKADEISEIVVPINYGLNSLVIQFTPDADYVNALGEIPNSLASISKSYKVNVRNYDNTVFYVAPGAKGSGAGTKEDPIDLYVAISYVQPGQKIILMDGVYELNYQIRIVKGNDGKEGAYKYLIADEGAHPVLDFKNSTTGAFVNWGNYWYFEGFDVCNSPDNIKGIQLAGSHCVMSRVNAYNNGDTGIQISGSASDPKAEWPVDNLVINCTSYNNMDSAMNNADGFAAKLTVGEGNKFVGCVSYNNIDDGWDLYAKVETGAIGVVTLENCIAYNNGFIPGVAGVGDGNGFKLGGDGIAVAHVLKNSVSFGNRTNGITSNSNPAVQVYNCITFGNGGSGIALYGKAATERTFIVEGVISMNNKTPDSVEEVTHTSVTNFYQNGKRTLNSDAKELTADIFENVDIANNIPSRDEKGNIVLNGLLVIKADAGLDSAVGAYLTKTETEMPEPEVTPSPVPTPSTSPEPTVTPDPTEAPEPTVAPTDTPASTPAPTEAPANEKTNNGPSPVIFIVIGVVAAAAIAAVVVVVLKKRKK